jgi:hypothetical protein
MPDDDRRNGGIMIGEGQRTIERLGGWAEIAIAVRDTLLLVAIAALRAAWVLVLSLLAGPPSLVALVPAAIDGIAAWLDDEHEPMGRFDAVALGALVALLLALAPDVALCWWPWRWQATRASWWGLWWPTWWPAAVPSVVLARGVLLAAIIAGGREVKYLRNRLRQEVAVPTMSGATFQQMQAHTVEIEGVVNPYRDPDAPAAPPVTEVTRAFIWRGDGAGANGARVIDTSHELATPDQLTQLAELVLFADVTPTRTQMTRRGVWTDPGWRAFQDWAVSQRLMEKTGTAANAPYTMTAEGVAWLRALVEGEEQ